MGEYRKLINRNSYSDVGIIDDNTFGNTIDYCTFAKTIIQWHIF